MHICLGAGGSAEPLLSHRGHHNRRTMPGALPPISPRQTLSSPRTSPRMLPRTRAKHSDLLGGSGLSIASGFGHPAPPAGNPRDGVQPAEVLTASGVFTLPQRIQTDSRYRRYHFDQSTQHPDYPLPLHYDVILPGVSGVDSRPDHLHYRYVDFMCAPPSSWHMKLLEPDDGLGLDVVQLCRFFQDADPWTRLDAYPMYVIVKDLLHKQLAGTLRVSDREGSRLRNALAAAEKREEAVAEVLQECQAKVARFEQADGVDKRVKELERQLSISESKNRMLLMKLASTKIVSDNRAESPANQHVSQSWEMAVLAGMIEEGVDDGRFEQSLLMLPSDKLEAVMKQMLTTASHIMPDKMGSLTQALPGVSSAQEAGIDMLCKSCGGSGVSAHSGSPLKFATEIRHAANTPAEMAAMGASPAEIR